MTILNKDLYRAATTTRAALLFCILSFGVHVSAENFITKHNDTLVHSSPSPQGKVIGKIPKGKKLVTGQQQGDFVQVTSKSGRAMWVKASDLEAPVDLGGTGEDLSGDVAKDDKEDDTRRSAPQFSWDLGAAAGSYDNRTYSEVQLGVNWYFLNWLAWRNAGFMRFVNPENIYGLDTSMRASVSPNILHAVGFTLFGGPGYRFQSKGDAVPFLEGGLELHMFGLNIGGGAKSLMYSLNDSKKSNDVQYFLILSGSGSF